MRADPRRLPWTALRALRGPAFRTVRRLYRVAPVRPGGLLLYRVRGHRGPAVALGDGTIIGRGAQVIELHVDNLALMAARDGARHSTWTAVAAIRADLVALAARDLGGAAALHGVSLIGSPGGRFGFEVRPLPRGVRRALLRCLMAGVDAIYHPQGLRRLGGRPARRQPVETWMSTSRLRRLYGETGPAADSILAAWEGR